MGREPQVGQAEAARRLSGWGGKSSSYEDWTKDDLQKKAPDVGIDGRSKMSKGELVSALRNH